MENTNQSVSKKRIYKHWWFWVLTFFILIFILGAVGGNANPNTSKHADTKVATPAEKTNVSTQTSSLTVTQTNNPPIPLPEKKLAYIPDLSGVDIYANLEKMGFTCKRTITSEYITWNCEENTADHLYQAIIIGTDPSKIVSIEATAQNYGTEDTNAITKDFLGYIASVPFGGSNPTSAKNWVLQNIGKNASTTYSGVSFELTSNGRTRTLYVGVE